MKYIMFEDFSGAPVPFIFPQRVDHADMREQMPYSKVLSAGYVIMENNEFTCYGGSPELQATSQPEDADIMKRKFSRREG